MGARGSRRDPPEPQSGLIGPLPARVGVGSKKCVEDLALSAEFVDNSVLYKAFIGFVCQGEFLEVVK